MVIGTLPKTVTASSSIESSKNRKYISDNTVTPANIILRNVMNYDITSEVWKGCLFFGMSQLVAKWDKSYVFSDEELASLIELQESINSPKSAVQSPPKPVAEVDEELCVNIGLPAGGLTTFDEWYHWHDQLLSSGNNNDDHFDFSLLNQQLNDVTTLKSQVESLVHRCNQLGEDHSNVKSKSQAMQAMWEGLLNQGSTFEQFAEKIEERLGIFTQFGRLEEALKVADPMNDPLKDEYQKALDLAIDNTLLIMMKPEYKEAQVNAFRYKQLINSAFGAVKTLFDRRMTELNMICREQDSPVNHTELLERYEATGKQLRPLLVLLEKAIAADNQLAHTRHDCMSKFLATRYNLAKRSRQAGTVEEAISQDQAKGVMEGAFEMLQEERRLFREYFGQDPAHQRHLDYFGEQALVPISERLRSAIDKKSPEELQAFTQWLQVMKTEGLCSHGLRLLDLTLQYCQQRLAP